MNKLILPEGHELRVELIRLYGDSQFHAAVDLMQQEVRSVTNRMVKDRQDVKDAVKAYVVRNKLLDVAPPVSPKRPELSTPVTDEDKAAVKSAWSVYKDALRTHGAACGAWMDKAFKVTKGIESLAWRKHKYQDLRKSCSLGVGNAVLFRDTVIRVNKTKRARFKKETDHVPLVWGNSALVETGEFYGYRRGVPWYNARITINGMKVLGRLRRPFPGKQVQGVTLSKKADGWYAAVKCIVPIRTLPEPTLEAIGIDVGQTDLVATVDMQGSVYTKENERNRLHAERIAGIQSVADKTEDPYKQHVARSRVARIHQKAKRSVKHWIDSTLLPLLSKYSVIVVEKLQKNFKSDKGPLSCMHTILSAIKQRFGDRVREVPPANTSRTCSHCGNISESARQGKRYTCVVTSCDHREDADINAARNILRKGTMSLAS